MGGRIVLKGIHQHFNTVLHKITSNITLIFTPRSFVHIYIEYKLLIHTTRNITLFFLQLGTYLFIHHGMPNTSFGNYYVQSTYLHHNIRYLIAGTVLYISHIIIGRVHKRLYISRSFAMFDLLIADWHYNGGNVKAIVWCVCVHCEISI